VELRGKIPFYALQQPDFSSYRQLPVPVDKLRTLRKQLGLSRSELARFLGVSEATIVRWEADQTVSEPRGLQAVLLTIVYDAVNNHPHSVVARAVRSSSWDHRDALRTLIDFSEPSRAEPSRAEPSRAEPSRAEPSAAKGMQLDARRR
jgi:DNA-binding transcriptional regulator YiaG